MKTQPRCWAEVDLSALRENLAWIRHRVGPQVKIMTVVKADAYGHGLKQIAALLMQSGTDIFGVANLAEAQAIRSVGRGWPILMLGAALPDEVETALRDEVMPTISTLEDARAFSAAAVKLRKSVRLHVKVDTGMGRLGVVPSQARELIRQASRLPGVKISGLYTHYSSVEDDADFSRRQRAQFLRLLQSLGNDGLQFEFLHANNSAGLLLESASIFNTVRPGLLVYGVAPPGKRSSGSVLSDTKETAVSTRPGSSPSPLKGERAGVRGEAVRLIHRLSSGLLSNLRPALTWKCRVSLVKEIPRGTPLSYGRTFIAPRRMRVATLTAGYGDGYLRSGSNRAQVLIGGQRCPLRGRITMDQMIADVSSLPAVSSGDEVVLIGRQGQDEITAGELAQWCGTVPWEVLTNITYRVPRFYRGGSAA